MSSVLIDNWNLCNADVVKNISGDIIPNDAYSDLLSALVLWDDVYYLDDGFSTFSWTYGKMGNNFREVLQPLYLNLDIRKQFENSADLIFSNRYKQNYSKVVAQRAIFYSEISKAFHKDYFPVKKRSAFLSENMDIVDLWTRNELIKAEEKEILLRINNFNNSDHSFIQFPLLAKLVVKNANNNGEYIKTALDIKATNEVRRFRKYMDKIDQEINQGNIEELRYVLSIIPEIVNDIQKMDKKIKLSTTVNIKITPAVISMATGAILSRLYTERELLSMGLFCGTLGALFSESNMEIAKEFNKIYYPKKIQTTFLRSLAKNALI